MKPLELYSGIGTGRRPSLLDVRNPEEFARWSVEGPGPLNAMNLPYYEFINDERSAVARVRAWKSRRTGGLVVVCSRGDSSAFVAEILREAGLPAENLEGGMAEWGAATARRPLEEGVDVRAWQILRFGKGCLSYVIAARKDAIVVDPHRRIDDYRKALKELKLRLRGVFDTHLHADHLSGARALAQAEGVPYYASPVDFASPAFEFTPARDGQRIDLGKVRVAPVTVLNAPGHTPGSLLLQVNDTYLLTGDTLFVSGLGRPDLGGRAREWASDLHATLTRRLSELDGGLLVLPAHTSGPAEIREDGTVVESLGTLRNRIPHLWMTRMEFVADVLSKLSPAPPGYERIRLANLGRLETTEEERTELELGKNECALARR